MTLEIDNVELYFSGKKILGGVYLKVETGQITGILGSNGCGKSCLLKIIFGDLRPKYGLIRLNGKPVQKALYKTGTIGYLPQQNYLPKGAKLKLLFRLYKVSWQNFIFLFKQFNKYENSKIKELSGGEIRLLEAYLIIKGHYKIILLDEPFSHLSPIEIKKIIALLNLEKSNKAIIITDHMYKHITTVSDSIYLIKNNCTILMDSFGGLKDYGYLTE